MCIECRDQGEDAASVLDLDVVKRYTANTYCIFTLPDSVLSVPSHIILKTALRIRYYYSCLQFTEEDIKTLFKRLGEKNTASKWQSTNTNPDSLAPEPMLLMTTL